MTSRIVRASAASYTGFSLAAAGGFFAAASWVGEAPLTAIVGGTVWVFILAMIVSTPLVTGWTRRHDAERRSSGPPWGTASRRDRSPDRAGVA